jgi:hypothetical protein
LSALKIPKSLILLPLLIVSVTFGKDFLNGFISLSDVVVFHLFDEAHVGSVSIVVLATIFTISLGFNSSQSANCLNLGMELGIEIGSSFSKWRVKDESVVLHLDFESVGCHKLSVGLSFLVGGEFLDPGLDSLF